MLLPRGFAGEGPRGREKCPVLYIPPNPILLEMLTQKNYTERSLGVIQDLQAALLAKRATKDIY